MVTKNIVEVEFFVGLIVGLLLGFVVGFIIALRSRKPENNISAVQILAVATLFGYIFTSFYFNREVSWVIAVSILATGYGAKGGEIIERVLERRSKS